ncbi:HNH endonuclease [Streptomyces sp. NPDC096205]|uniref:HNH endonuclease n=1 Tax=Streptomyces sp. NPDC096205 TaxID=3366081 RepID=UPI0038005F3B
MDHEALTSAVSQSRTWNELMRRLGLKPSGGQRRALQREVAAHGIDISHFTRHRYSDPAIAAAAACSSTLREVALKLAATPATGTLAHIRRRIEAAGLDTSHFKRRSWGAAPRPRSRAADECVSCGNNGEWLGQSITLQIDHIDGDWLDNRAENLRYLCPNCPALTATWCRKKARRGESGHPRTLWSPDGTG